LCDNQHFDMLFCFISVQPLKHIHAHSTRAKLAINHSGLHIILLGNVISSYHVLLYYCSLNFNVACIILNHTCFVICLQACRPLVIGLLRVLVRSPKFWVKGLSQAYYDPRRLSQEVCVFSRYVDAYVCVCACVCVRADQPFCHN